MYIYILYIHRKHACSSRHAEAEICCGLKKWNLSLDQYLHIFAQRTSIFGLGRGLCSVDVLDSCAVPWYSGKRRIYDLRSIYIPPPSNNGCQLPRRFAIWWLLYRESQVWASLSPGTQVLSVFTKLCSRASGTLGAFGSVCGVDGVLKSQGQCTET